MDPKLPTTDPELLRLLEESRKQVDVMTDDELAQMHAEQRKSYSRSIMEWPKPSKTVREGVVHYASYEDYCND